jgi:DNA-binding transcriptional MerR regulator
MSQLTDDQKTEIQQLTQSMKDSGATPQEIRDAVNAKLQEWGIQLPERSGGQHQLSPWMSQLTDDQKEEIQQLVESLRESGASPKEIRDAVKATLEGWGIEVPEPVGRGQRLSPWMSQLTDEQKAQIQQLIQSMRDDGATPQEIRDAVNAKLQEWGIQLPPPPQSPGQ